MGIRAARWVAAILVPALGMGGAVAIARPARPAGAGTLTEAGLALGATPSSAGVGSTALDPWFVAASLLKLRAEIDERWPGRDRSSDGTIGDVFHQARNNSHNPVGSRRGPTVGTPGAVHSMDITAAGIDVDTVLAAVIGDPRVGYVIYDGRIWSRKGGWSPRAYEGDPHVTHIHVTTREDSQAGAAAAENDTSRWLPTPVSLGSLHPRQVQVIQRALIRHGFGIPAGPTGKYGGQTTAAMAAFQRAQGWSGGEADGKPGPLTLKRLGVGDLAAAKAKAEKAAKAKAKAAKAKAKAAKAAKAKAKAKAAKAKGANSAAKAKGPKGRNAKARVGAKGKVKAGEKAEKSKAAKGAKARAARAKAAPGNAAQAKAKAATAQRKAVKPSGRLDAADLVPGIASADVYYLQAALAEAGYPIPAGLTGYFGPRTRDAIAAFQRAQGWTGDHADGIPGPGTLRRLGL